MKAQLPSNETARLNVLHRYNILDTLPEKDFDDLTQLAAHICQTPTAMIGFVDSNRQWFKSKVGFVAKETSRDDAFCAHTILQTSPLIIPDACQDERFVDNPLVTCTPKIRFYAGIPLFTSDNFALGSLCVIDYVPRQLSSQQQEALDILARQVMTQLELRRNLAALKQVIHQSKQTQQALRESKERYRRLVELSPETIAVHSEGKFVYINKTGAKLLAASNPQEIIGKPVLDFVESNYPEIVKSQVWHVQAQETQTEVIEQKMVRLDGAIVDVAATGIPVTYQGKPATQVVIIDITGRKKAEAALQESENKYQDLFENASDLIQSVTPEGDFIYVNPAWQETLGYSEAEIQQMKVYDIIHPDSLVTCLEVFGRVMSGEKFVQVEAEFISKDGRKIWVEGSINCKFGDGKPTATRGIFRNISERKYAEAALQNAYNQLELRIEERTVELTKINQQLRNEIVERRRAEEEVQLLQKITPAISESQNFHASLEVALRQICEFTGWSFGEAWIPGADSTVLQLSPAWYCSDESPKIFRILSYKFKFPLGTGLPGGVWSSKQPKWIPQLEDESSPSFLRAHLAYAAGFKAALGIPIIAHTSPDSDPEVLAVLVFFMSETCEEDKRLVEIVSTVATQLGSLVQRKRAEEALRESDARYSTLVKQTSEGIFLVDAETKRILEANEAFAHLLGYTCEQLVGLTLYDIVVLDRASIDCNLERVLRQKNYFIGEAPHRRCDGEIAYADVNVNVIFQGGREVFCVVAHDVTERKRAQEALRESEQRLKAILDNSTALIYVKDTEGKYILINAWYGILFHLDRHEVQGKTDYDIFPSEIADVFKANDKNVLEAKAALDWEEVFPHDDGLHTYLSIKFPLYNAAGDIYAICGISTDITERKRAEEALRSSLATNRALINAMPDVLFRISADGTYVNYKASKDYELPLPPNELLGKKVNQILPSEVALPMMQCIQQALMTGEVQIFEYQLVLHELLQYYEARIVVSAEDEVMAIVRNITERKRAEAEIRNALEKEKELSDLKSRFVTMASHEFRTPLTTILSSAELLEDYGERWSQEKKLNHLRRIAINVKHMTQLLNDVLLIGKAEAGKLECSPSALNVVQFCQDLVEEMQTITDSHKINFNYQCDRSSVVLDEKLLRHILNNLLSNAIKYSPKGGNVYFNLVCTSSVAIFRIQDEGIGIPELDKIQLFESFYRASNVGTISGTGLGLAIVKRSVDSHGGSITVESEVGVGTTFVVSLPLNLLG